jgi:serine/threonine protein kinase
MCADLAIGSRILAYRIDALLGRGGQGTVYEAEHIHLGRKVALKVLLPELANDDGFRRRFTQEARLAAQLDHPNILDVYDFGDVDGMLFLAVKFVDGVDLATLVEREGGLAPDRTLALLGGVADGLDTAHAAGLVHRDVKPGNILIEERRGGREHSYLSDFGLTKSVAATQDVLGTGPLTRTGYFVGTPEYAAPEQIESKEIDGRTDQYALGCVLFQCLTGRLPFPRDSLGSALVAHMMEAPPRVSDVRADLSPRIDGVVAKAMAKTRAERFDTCDEMMAAAKDALVGTPGLGVAPPPMPKIPPPLSPMPDMPQPPRQVTPSPTPVPPPLTPIRTPLPPPPAPRAYPPLQQVGSQRFPPPQAQPQGLPPPVVPDRLAATAKRALLLGIFGIIGGLFVIGVPLAIIAVVQGNRATQELNRFGGSQIVRSNARTGSICGWIGIGLASLVLLIAIANASS